jgi:4-hydroxybenzoate polyprenyltransferase
MVDRDDDLKLGIRSSAIFFGRWDVAAVMACYGGFFSLMLLVGYGINATWPYYAGWAFGVLCALYHHALIRTRSRDGCFAAFRHNNWVGLALFVGTLAHYLK